jgi:hypothetical protein
MVDEFEEKLQTLVAAQFFIKLTVGSLRFGEIPVALNRFFHAKV